MLHPPSNVEKVAPFVVNYNPWNDVYDPKKQHRQAAKLHRVAIQGVDQNEDARVGWVGLG